MTKISAQETLVHLSHHEAVNAVQVSKVRLMTKRWKNLFLARTFCGWGFSFRRRRRSGQAARLGILRLECRSIWKALHRWVHVVNAAFEREQLKNATVGLLIRRWAAGSLWHAFQTWSRVLEKEAAKIAIDRQMRVLLRLRFAAGARAFEKMKFVLVKRKQAATLCLRIVAKLLGYLQVYVLERWKMMRNRRTRCRSLQNICLFIVRRVMVAYCVRSLQIFRGNLIRIRKMRSFRGLLQNRFSAKAFHGWWHACLWHVNRRIRLLKMLRRWQLLSLSMSLERWREQIREDVCRRAACVRILKRWMLRVERGALEGWWNQYHHQVRLRKKGMAIIHRLQCRLVSRAFRSFDEHALQTKRSRHVLLVAVFKWYRRSLSKVFASWSWGAARLAKMRSKLTYVCIRFAKRNMCSAYDQLHEQTRLIRRTRGMLNQAIKRWRKRVLAASFSGLVESSYKNRKTRVVGRRAAFRCASLALAAAFTGWANRIHMMKHRVKVLMRILLRWRNSQLQWALGGWLTQHARRARLKFTATKVGLRMMLRTLGIALDKWIDIVWQSRDLDSATKNEYNTKSRRNRLFERVCFRWQNAFSSAAFSGWREHSSRARILRHRCVKSVRQRLWPLHCVVPT